MTLVVECAVPFLAFGPRRLRQPAFAILTGFQGLIALTGNYAFFNWLTAVLNLGLVELPPSTTSREKIAAPGGQRRQSSRPWWPRRS